MEKKEEKDNPPLVLSIPLDLIFNKYDANIKQHLDKGKLMLVKKNKVEANKELKFKWINSKGMSVLDATKIKVNSIPARLKKFNWKTPKEKVTFNFAISFTYYPQVEVEPTLKANLLESIKISQLEVSIEATVMDEAYLIATGARMNNNNLELDLELSVHFEGRITGTEQTRVWKFKAISEGILSDVGN